MLFEDTTRNTTTPYSFRSVTELPEISDDLFSFLILVVDWIPTDPWLENS